MVATPKLHHARGHNLPETGSEAIDYALTALAGVVRRSIEGADVLQLDQLATAAIVHDPAELASEADDPGCLLILQHARDRHCDVGVEVLWLAREMRGKLLRQGQGQPSAQKAVSDRFVRGRSPTLASFAKSGLASQCRESRGRAVRDRADLVLEAFPV